ncbi:MAG: hypothetical protein WD206_09320 [Actinomycetota bacterium]
MSGTGRDTTITPVLVLVAAGMLLVGSCLGWVSVEAVPLSLSLTGIATWYGIVTFVCGVATLGIGIVAMVGGRIPIALLAAAGIVAVVLGTVAVADRASIGEDALAERTAEVEGVSVEQARAIVEQARRFGVVEVSGGTGLYLVVAGGLCAAAAAWLAAAGRRRPPARGPAPPSSTVVVDVPPPSALPRRREDPDGGREPPS